MQQEALYGVEQAGHHLARLLDSGWHLVRQLHARRLDSITYITAWCSLMPYRSRTAPWQSGLAEVISRSALPLLYL